ncbi:hypothetical protein [Caloranaerobacter sp. DY30410]|uniref:hypothetical protein n=1 Tax=Caloranaerobacter sp. DY30410 TaxID=3238305 RepID=UPI003D026040
MNKTKNLFSFLLALFLIVASFSGVDAQNESKILSDEIKKEIIANLIELGVTDKSVQSNLIKKLERGEI